jgi:hypothetical protein
MTQLTELLGRMRAGDPQAREALGQADATLAATFRFAVLGPWHWLFVS